jgi:opacity protein-like surface antigen
MIGSTIFTDNTAFLHQSTAFVSSPPDPKAEQQGGGIWVRGVGGTVDVQSSTTTAVTATFPAGAAAPVRCSQKVDESFAGVQFGSDVAKLNVNGWNLHVGATAGYLGTRGNLVGGAFAYLDPSTALAGGGGPFTSTTQIPFAGVYAVATNGGFFVDGILRAEYYQTSLNAPGAILFDQSIDAHGYSFSSSIGYNWQVPNSRWFVEPSAGIIISRIDVDPFNFVTAGTAGTLVGPGTPFSDRISGTLQINKIDSDIGRVGLRIGTAIELANVVWQPFGAVSVWHEFGPNVTSSFRSCPFCVFDGVTPTTISATSSTSTFGTFGQYSLGVSAALAGTGWLGFARVDYQDGPNLQGLSGTGGILYRFNPAADTKSVMAVKAPVHKAPETEPPDWTGLYVGGFGGAALGTADWNYANGAANPYIGGFVGGIDIGHNWQKGAWVFGAEGDAAWTNAKGDVGCGPLSQAGIHPTPLFNMSCGASQSWVATITPRIGYVLGRDLLYIKGGAAFIGEKFSATCDWGPLNGYRADRFTKCTPVFPDFGTISNGFSAGGMQVGWTIGFGSEFALTSNWSAKAEADYVSVGDSTMTASDGTVLNAGAHVFELKIGVNYRLDVRPFLTGHSL